jgi:fluoroquinolone resistance protein
VADRKHGRPAPATDSVVRNWDDADPSGQTYTRVLFIDSDLTEVANQGGVFETRCKLMGSMFDDCTYNLLKVEGGDWSFVGLPGADLRGTELTGTRLREADLTALRAAGATMRDVDLSGAWLHSADLSGCDLRGSDLSTVDPLTVNLKNAIVDLTQAMVITTSLGLDVRP